MIDIHCHILPGVDDGPETLEEAVAMCAIAREDGIDTIVATPHFRADAARPGRVEAGIHELRKELERRRIDVRILGGADVSVTPELRGHLSEDRSLFINGTGRYFLAELPHEAVPAAWERFLLSFRNAGITPILTHPERNRWFLSRPGALYSYVAGGGLVQITAKSVTGGNGAEARGYCEVLLKHNLAQVIATDAHSPDLRPPILSEAFRAAADIIGERAARRTVVDAPLAIIEGKEVATDEPSPPARTRKKWYRAILDL